MATSSLLQLAALLVVSSACLAQAQTCSGSPPLATHDYSAVLGSSRKAGIAFEDLPGFTRSAYFRDHALITPESRVWAPLPGWTNTVTAHLMSPASGAVFSMFLAEMKAESTAGQPAAVVERFVFVLSGQAEATDPSGKVITLSANHYAYFPPNTTAKLSATEGCGLVVYERVYAGSGSPAFVSGNTEESPLLPPGGLEVFELRKLLPQTADFDFNIHIMDFQPGEHLHTKEIHYNQHGLLLLEGKGIYRLADKWYPVQAGDAIWMAPYVLQWYGALGKTPTRYIIFKDTTVDPLFS